MTNIPTDLLLDRAYIEKVLPCHPKYLMELYNLSLINIKVQPSSKSRLYENGKFDNETSAYVKNLSQHVCQTLSGLGYIQEDFRDGQHHIEITKLGTTLLSLVDWKYMEQCFPELVAWS